MTNSEEIEFPLTTNFTYATRGGETTEARFIQLTAPTSKNSRECAALKQAFFRSVPDSTDSDPDPDSVDLSGHDVIMTIAMSPDVDLPDVIDVGRKLFSSGVAKVDGEVKLTNHLIDRMSQDDLEAMLGEYMVGFTLASSLARMREKSSPES